MKSLGTDAFIAFGSEPSREVRLRTEWNCDKGVRSRQKFRCVEVIRCNGEVFTSLFVAGVRNDGATTGSEILESHEEEIRSALLRTLSVSAARRRQLQRALAALWVKQIILRM